MALRDLLILVDENGKDQPTLRAGLDLAQRHQAHLTALRLRRRPPMPAFVAAQLPDELLPQIEARVKEEAAEARVRVERVALREEVPFEWRALDVANGDAADLVGLHARYADLLLVGQPPLDDAPEGYEALVETLLVSAGRPVLLVPAVGAPKGFGKRILVAWDGGREAARAVADALPLLRAADQVEIVTVDAKRLRAPEPEPGADIARHLARHGVKASVTQLTRGPLDVADILLNRASDHGFDLIVMGAYAHSRLRDLVLGGVTRQLLRHMTVPLFTAH